MVVGKHHPCRCDRGFELLAFARHLWLLPERHQEFGGVVACGIEALSVSRFDGYGG